MAEQKLRYVVEVVGDSASGSLAAISKAFNQAGINADVAFKKAKGGANDAETALKGLKSELASSERTVNYFTRSLSNFGPAGQTAQMALGGIADLIMGGGAFAVGFAAAELGVRFLSEALQDEAKAAAEAKKKNDAVFSKLISDATASQSALQDFNARARGLNPEALNQRAIARDLEGPVKAAKATLDYARQMRELEKSSAATGGGATDKSVAKWDAEVKAADEAYSDLESKQRAALENARNIETAAALESQERLRSIIDAWNKELEDKAKAAIEKEKADYDRKYGLFYSHLDRVARASEKAAKDEDERREKANAAGQKALDHRARTFENNAEKSKRSAESQARDAQMVGATYGAIVGDVATGAMSLQQGLAAVGQQITRMVVDSAIASITADAARAGAGAAASQAGIPIFGPVLAISAMGAMVASVLALLGKVGASAAGGFDVGNFAPLTQLHPREMVLPAKLANRVRDMTGGGGGTTIINLGFHDTRDADRWLQRHQGALLRVLDDASRKRRG